MGRDASHGVGNPSQCDTMKECFREIIFKKVVFLDIFDYSCSKMKLRGVLQKDETSKKMFIWQIVSKKSVHPFLLFS